MERTHLPYRYELFDSHVVHDTYQGCIDWPVNIWIVSQRNDNFGGENPRY